MSILTEPMNSKIWLGNLNVSPLAIERCLDAGQATWFIPLHEHEEVFFKFPVYSTDAASELVHLSFLCKPNLVVTLHTAPLASLDHAIKGLTGGMILSQPTISALVGLLLFLGISQKSQSIRGPEKGGVRAGGTHGRPTRIVSRRMRFVTKSDRFVPSTQLSAHRSTASSMWVP